jgi:hypothetical protein
MLPDQTQEAACKRMKVVTKSQNASYNCTVVLYLLLALSALCLGRMEQKNRKGDTFE